MIADEITVAATTKLIADAQNEVFGEDNDANGKNSHGIKVWSDIADEKDHEKKENEQEERINDSMDTESVGAEPEQVTDEEGQHSNGEAKCITRVKK